MIQVRRGEGRYRGGDAGAGIESLHAFSFSGFYDPENVRFGALVACNEERLKAGAGFGEHQHRDMEIVTWVVEGELIHRDSEGNERYVRPGDVQHLSAGSGVTHVERNDGDGPLRFVQMWLMPRGPGGKPAYELVRGIADGTPLAVEAAGALLHVRRLAPGERTALPDAPWVYAHVVRGTVGLGGEEVREGDAARIAGAEGLEITAAGGPAEVLVWEMNAAGPEYG
ncbi:pirin family protein [Streptomyces smaragdinus]|uniref:pirin family protein n=1 Tax=Streptomyces smaragdinus TaxID=2585196 RepID=UPI002B2118E4|nr:pirin family protein [Streptomyces smaragdinus]